VCLLRSSPRTKRSLESDGTIRAIRGANEDDEEEAVLYLGIERTGELGIVECRGKIVRSEAAHKLLGAVLSLRDARTIVLDLSGVGAIEGDGLGVLLFLQRWAHDHHIQLKLFDPIKSVRERLERAHTVSGFDIPTLREMMALLSEANSRFGLAA
jgi:anti-anti-sigma regulatory factor